MASNNAVAAEVSTAMAKLNDHLATALTGADASNNNSSSNTIITLAGENSGATMEAVAGDVAEDLVVVGSADAEDNADDSQQEEEDDVVVSAYTNSNYQAVNNSVLVSGSCAVNDPGVHVVVVEHVDEIRDYDDDDHLDGQEF
ncbi:hypothetical protein HU200_012587 [Digitaria exilis]|uniref:Uncharacterized protein n=1 Tax=Digitaria exilis TaxID=1010633 RepID=A0A835FFY2_9POAL|nr:hypothetical protein HU200_012587 [Digitaria exilis]CAB3486343.1 unnamed protein product [Digitaria exilis]